MTGLIDGRAIKVLSFEIGKTYGGYVVESRTACFVTFQGQKRRKVEICDGVESVPVYTYQQGIERIVDIAAFEEHPNDIAPELNIVAIYDNRTAKALPAPSAHEMATPIKVQEPSFQEVADKAIAHGYTLINISSAVNPLPMYRLINTETGLMAHDFSMINLADVSTWLDVKHQSMINLADVSTWLDVKHQSMVNTVNTAFIAGQTYEAPNGNTYTVTNRLGDSLELKNECGYVSTHKIHRDSNGEYVRPQLDSMKLYAGDTPSWFYPATKPTWYSVADIEATRAQIRRELDQDSISLIEDRDADKAANLSMRGLV
jgi:hypothetical protein